MVNVDWREVEKLKRWEVICFVVGERRKVGLRFSWAELCQLKCHGCMWSLQVQLEIWVPFQRLSWIRWNPWKPHSSWAGFIAFCSPSSLPHTNNFNNIWFHVVFRITLMYYMSNKMYSHYKYWNSPPVYTYIIYILIKTLKIRIINFNPFIIMFSENRMKWVYTIRMHAKLIFSIINFRPDII